MLNFFKGIFGINKLELNRKYGFVSGMDYLLFSVEEKLKYHKYKGDTAERLSHKRRIADVVKEKSLELYINNTDQSRFKISNSYTYLSESDILDMHIKAPELVWEGEQNYKIRASREGIMHCLWISNSNGEEVLSSMGNDNVIQWKSIEDRDNVLKMIEELYLEVS